MAPLSMSNMEGTMRFIVQGDGKILVTRSSADGGGCEIVRLNGDGTGDEAFGQRSIAALERCAAIEHPLLGTLVLGERQHDPIAAVRLCP